MDAQSDSDKEEDPDSSRTRTARARAEDAARRQPAVTKFPGGAAGKPVNTSELRASMYEEYSHQMNASADNPWAPFASKLDWEVARWAKLRGPGSTALTELLQIDGVHELLNLSFKDADTLNKVIDALPGRPKFKREELVVAGEVFDLHYRDVIECIHALYGDPEFAVDLVFAPERHYADEDRTIRVYSNMYTGKWWWATQKELERQRPGATIIPVILSSDKTQVTLFGNKSAYPIYMTIGNLPKEIRRKPSRGGHILLGYLPTTRLDHITNKAARRHTLANLFHSCVQRILSPLRAAGQNGLLMPSGDGVHRRTHPLFAMFVGDYPEQVLVAGIKTGDCLRCDISHHNLGEFDPSADYPFRELDPVLDALGTISEGPTAFVKACKEIRIKPIQHPFWEDLPYANVFQSITPDILHRLYQGVMKHVISWVMSACGAHEIDARCRRFPPNHQICIFMKGISTLSKITGHEHAQMCQLLLGMVMDIKLPNHLPTSRLVRAVRAILDFCYLAQYPVHTDNTLSLLKDALGRFHDEKDIFIALGIRSDFNFPKLHALLHYLRSIQLFGTTDNYNTEYTEWLHIDLAKDAYRATNHKDEYPQMTRWLERREKVIRHDRYISWRLGGCPPIRPLPHLVHKATEPGNLIRMAKHPSLKAVPLSRLPSSYGVMHFQAALARFVVQYHNPHFTQAQIELDAESTYIHFATIPVFHKIKFCIKDPFGREESFDRSDTVHVRPVRQDSRSNNVPARFDTVLVNLAGGETEHRLQGYRVAQVRLVFSLPSAAAASLFRRPPPEHLAYVEWFSPFTRPDQNSGMYKVSRSIRGGVRLASVIPASQIMRSVHLLPKFGPVVPREWSSSTVLDSAPAFFVNPYLDRHSFTTFL
ncbi:hypothetical protein OE88DRAFT_1626862 [Heliocybe sulcata]|uniref:Uncharacterized protein n=1 Tax=Heliocybe sulcata TaxID=5364 RepID=A0A5C3NB11_9AGAM|nr:hypothetical protein OE88DRAFT_1626862 [Heliocybe sulcata]